jgi:hypothetical protein
MKEDWIFWNVLRVSDAYFQNPQNSAIGKYIGNFTTNLFRCPGDYFMIEQDKSYRATKTGNPYLYTYTVPSIYIPSDRQPNHGMTSIFDGTKNPFKSAWIVNPTRKLMVVEENGDPAPILDTFADDGRWTEGNLLSARHGIGRVPRTANQTFVNNIFMKKGRAVVVLADGHVDTVPPAYGRIEANYDPIK